ncbi:conserved hypothetical protein [Parafrankia sp. EUN1f]|nr:conserved hypothetical protein [Parafrankia sp. EUN1f]
MGSSSVLNVHPDPAEGLGDGLRDPSGTPCIRLAPVRGSAVWRYFGDARNSLMGPQLLVLQVAHPVVGAGVREHSNFRDDPWGRLLRTLLSLSTVIYGGERGAALEGERLFELHKAMGGVDEKGRRYHALNPEAYAWVHATLVQGALDGHRVFGAGLPAAELDGYYQGMRDIGRMLGIPEQHLPADYPSFRTYYEEKIAARLEDNQAVWDVLESMRVPKKPFRLIPGRLWRPAGAGLGRLCYLVTVGTLPPVLRERLGLTWSKRQQRWLRRFARLVRVLMVFLIPPLRIAGGIVAATWNVRQLEDARSASARRDGAH